MDKQKQDVMDNHKCKMVAKCPHMGEGREMWLGELLEPIEGHPQEAHCLHITTPYKSVVFGFNGGDVAALTVLCQIAHGQPVNQTWIDSMIKRYTKAAVDG